MKWLTRIVLILAFSIFNFQFSIAQYYDWGASPASVRWRRIKTPAAKLIYPVDFEANARRVMWYMDTVRTHINFGFRHGTMRTPVVMHTRGMSGNGMVMWAPRRMELLAAPAASYSEPWLKQLVFHEYRHNVQYNNLRRGLNRPLMWLLGQQIAFLGVGQFSIFILEGDATMAETEMSAFGRGLQPSFTMHYRAVAGDKGDKDDKDDRDKQSRGPVGSKNYSRDYWFSGSFRDYVPDHYRLGYQMARWSYNNFGEFVWDDVARYVARNPQFIVPMSIGLRRHWGMGQTELFRRTFADLDAYWGSLPRVEDSSTRVATPETSYTTYRWPIWIDDETLIALKTDLDRPSRLVRVDVASGREQVLTHTGDVTSRPVLADGVLWWTELRRSVLWPQKSSSRLISLNLTDGRKETHRSDEQILYPTPTTEGNIAHVAYDYSGRYTIVNGPDRLALPPDIEVTGLAWDDTTGALYFIGLDDGGMFLASATYDDGAGYQRLTPSRHITISDLRAGGGRLYFGSIASGRDEAHAFDLATATELRLSTSTYGSFQPSTPAPVGGRVALTTYDRHGYHLAVQDASAATEQPQRPLPENIVNPPWKRWDVPKMDSIVYIPTAESDPKKTRRYSKLLNVFHPHSWVPADFNPSTAISEGDLTMRLGATVLSQSLLSDAVSWLSYGWSRSGGQMVRGGVSYSGLGPVLDVDFSWGGAPQTTYTRVPLTLKLERQLSVTTRLSLPMTLSSGHWLGSLTPSAEYHYTNGLIYTPLNPTSGQLTRGVERLSLALRYSGQTRMAQKEFQPRWGVAARVGYVTNPTNRDFSSLWTASLSTWLPGVVRPHGTTLRAAWQQTSGGGGYTFRMKELFPRGAAYDFSARRWAAASVDYQLPVWYPEAGIPGVVYFKRVRLNAFVDYARWQSFASSGTVGGASWSNASTWNTLWSWGGDVIVDISPLRMPATNRFSARLTLAQPSDRRGLFIGGGLEMPL
ncbi:MAG: hypothetical protein LBV38_07160 [Alistipes sp.]|jgi:hypothetical protein|nr:hypothetical protein [Alistipes sp.]